MDLIATVVVFLGAIGVTGLPVAARIRVANPLTRLAAGIGAALVVAYLACLAVYGSGVDWRWLWLWPTAATAWAWHRRSPLRDFLAEPIVRTALAGWLIVTAWCLGLHATVFSYSGAAWSLDWIEHYQRARYFFTRAPADTLFVGLYLLPARPPLANLVEAGFMGLTNQGFSQHQLFSTLLSTLVFFPLAALTQLRGVSTRALHTLTVLLLLHPLFNQNATFPWTKLPAAFFVLLAVVLLLEPAARNLRDRWVAPALVAGLLVHYSVAPWILALALGCWVAAGRFRLQPGQARSLALGLLGAVLLGSTWLLWVAGEFGPSVLFSATSTVGHAPDVGWTGRLGIALANLRYSLLPEPDSPIGALLLGQPEFLGGLRDAAFVFYQLNLLLAFGAGNLLVLGWLVLRQPPGPVRRAGLAAVPLVVVLGIAGASRLDYIGLTHIALQPLVLLGLAWVATGADTLPRGLRLCWYAGLTVDFVLGVVLHFGLQSLAPLRWLHPGRPSWELIRGLNDVAVASFEHKYRGGQPFLADLVAGGLPFLAGGLVLLLGTALYRARRPGRIEATARTET